MDRRVPARIAAAAAFALLACLLAAPLASRADAAASKTPVLRAAFYYPWFPQAWQQGGIRPFTQYQPSLGYYSSGRRKVVRQQIADMQYGHIQAGIASWWGQGTKTDGRIPLLLNAAAGTMPRVVAGEQTDAERFVAVGLAVSLAIGASAER
ncbi:MAG: hypothetical protein QOK40_1651 [Miltoncostaeaceae bacterium]|nr:hypothetical protein [Miltoncostaeaceae bacterium]